MATNIVPNSSLRFQMILYLETTRPSEGEIAIDFEADSIIAAAERICGMARGLDECRWIKNWRIQAVMHAKSVESIHKTTKPSYQADLN